MMKSLIASGMQKYRELPERDQRAALILGIALVPAIIYFALVFPLQKAHRNTTAELETKLSELRWMQESVQKVRALGSSGGQMRQGRTLSQVVSDSTPRFQLQISRIQPRDNDELQVWLEDAKFENVLRWLYQCEQEFGLVVTNINLSVTKNPGYVKVQVKFKG